MVNIIVSGDWWRLEDDGTLYVFCVGDMPSREWGDYISVITSVVIADSVTSISAYAFNELSALESITIPDSVTEIEEYAVSYCPNLTDIAIPNSVTSIGYQAFTGCTALTSVTIPGSVSYADSRLFEGCTSLTSAVFGEGFEVIPYAIFDGCFALERVTIPDSVTEISAVFMGFYNLSDVYYSGTEEQWNSISIMDGNDDLWNATIHYNYVPPAPGPGKRIQIRVFTRNGDTLDFDECAIEQLWYVQSTSFDGNDMQADECSALIRQSAVDWLSRWNSVNRACAVIITIASRTEKYYFKSIRRVKKYDFELTVQSPLGRLTDDFPGDLYSNEPLPDVLAAVLNGAIAGNGYSINPLLQRVKVYGWIPYQERRLSLHQLVLAYGFLIRRDENHNLYFTVPDTEPYDIPSNAIFAGGSVDYSVGSTYARADITAYDYLQRAATDEEILFENLNGPPAYGLVVRFDSPAFDLRAEGLTISKSGVNYAVVSGSGRLFGKRYAKIESVISVGGDADADPQHVLSVSGVQVITSLNAANVGERLLSYYNAPATVTMDILRTSQRSGDCVSFVDPFGDAQTGYITSLSGSITSIDRATASVVCGYEPIWGAAYDTLEILTGPGTWTVPDFLDGKRIRVVLIGGGTGGASGQHGTDASGKGGIGGTLGMGGKVYATVVDSVTAGQTFAYQCGAGGAGGAATDATSDNLYVNAPGAAGTASTFGEYSSDNGERSDFGFYDMLNNVVYAAPGAYNGADGGAATTGSENGDRLNPAWIDVQRYAVNLPWDASQSWISGSPGAGEEYHETNPSGTVDEWAYGGLGGGAAVGADGEPGADAPYSARGGDGGNGANALPIFPVVSYGSGGSGGHGGGEGGKGGTGNHAASYDEGGSAVNGAWGVGGSGSAGQDGADGCILIYYKSS